MFLKSQKANRNGAKAIYKLYMKAKKIKYGCWLLVSITFSFARLTLIIRQQQRERKIEFLIVRNNGLENECDELFILLFFLPRTFTSYH